MLPLLKKKKKNLTAGVNYGLDTERTLLVPVCEMSQSCSVDQLSVAHAVVCALSFCSLRTLRVQHRKGFAGM